MRLRISTRLTLWYGLTLVVLLSLFASFSYVFFHASLHSDFDRHLTHEKRQLMPYVDVRGGALVFTGLDELHSVAYQTDGIYGTYVRLLGPAGTVLYRSPNFSGHEPLPVQLPAALDEATFSRTWDGQPARTLYTPIPDEAGRLYGWLEVTGFEWSLHQELYRLRTVLVAGTVLSVLLAIGGGYLLARRALRPVSALTESANGIRATDLSARLPTRFGVRDELAELAETFNRMLDRIAASFERERRFTDNAAHELLTPLATLRNAVEVVLRRRREPDVYEEKLRQVLLDVDELTDTVRGLLQLSRVDRLRDLPREPVDLGRVAEEHAARFRERAAAQEINLTVDVEAGPLVVSGEEVRLGEVVDNLLDNALKYTPDGGRVVVRVGRRGEGVVLRVTDTGVGFDEEQGARLFDRFYRADTPEVQARAGSGLGLSIVEAIVQAFGGTIMSESPGPGQGSTFEVRLPLASGS